MGAQHVLCDYVIAGDTPVLVHNTNCGMTISLKQLQKKFKHASDFGVDGNWGPANAARFENALKAHVNDSATLRIRECVVLDRARGVRQKSDEC